MNDRERDKLKKRIEHLKRWEGKTVKLETATDVRIFLDDLITRVDKKEIRLSRARELVSITELLLEAIKLEDEQNYINASTDRIKEIDDC